MAKSRAMSYLLPNGPEEGGFSDSCFAKWFVEFDEHKLRPFLIRNYSFEVVLLQDALQEMITKEFDTNNPDDIAIHIDGLSKATQSIALQNSLIIQHGRERSGTAENLLKKSFGLGLSRPLPMSASLIYAMTSGASHASKPI